MEETYFSTEKVTGQVQRVIAPRTAEALTLFCTQSKEFTQASTKTELSVTSMCSRLLLSSTSRA